MSENRVSLCVSVPSGLEIRYRQIAQDRGIPLSRVVELATVPAEDKLMSILDALTNRREAA